MIMGMETVTNQVVDLATADFDATIQRDLTLVDFWAPWCGPCRMQAPVLDQVAAQFGAEVRIARVNVDEEPQLAHRYQIHSIPTLLLFREGQIFREFVGTQSVTTLVSAIKAALGSRH